MRRYVHLIVLIVPTLAMPAQAGPFGKRTTVNPDTRVPELLYIVKSDPDEGKRVAAATELRDYDGKKYPDIALVLADVLQHDTKPSVRREAAISLGRVRPIHVAAGQALQKAASKDPALRVRVQAWSSLKLYQLSGYSVRSNAQPPAPTQTTTAAAKVQPRPAVVQQGVARVPTTASTKEPPLADPPAVIDIDFGSSPTPSAARTSAPSPRATPVSAPGRPAISRPSTPATAPAAPPAPVNDGPSLGPQDE